MVKSKRILAYLLVLTMLASMAVAASAGAYADGELQNITQSLGFAVPGLGFCASARQRRGCG